MIKSFTDRRPGVSAALIAVFFFAVPGVLMFADDMLFRGALHMASVFFFLSLAAQTVMMAAVERPILIMEPFLLGLALLVVADVAYYASMAAGAPGAGPSYAVYVASAYGVSVGGGNAAAAVGALILHFLILAGRKIYEHFKYKS